MNAAEIVSGVSEFLTSAEARRILRMARSTFYDELKRGNIPHYRLGPRRVRLTREGLETYLRRHRA